MLEFEKPVHKKVYTQLWPHRLKKILCIIIYYFLHAYKLKMHVYHSVHFYRYSFSQNPLRGKVPRGLSREDFCGSLQQKRFFSLPLRSTYRTTTTWDYAAALLKILKILNWVHSPNKTWLKSWVWMSTKLYVHIAALFKKKHVLRQLHSPLLVALPFLKTMY